MWVLAIGCITHNKASVCSCLSPVATNRPRPRTSPGRWNLNEFTLNQFFVVAIAEKISAMETANFFEQRAALGSAQSAQAAWDKVGARAPQADDRWTK